MKLNIPLLQLINKHIFTVVEDILTDINFLSQLATYHNSDSGKLKTNCSSHELYLSYFLPFNDEEYVLYISPVRF